LTFFFGVGSHSADSGMHPRPAVGLSLRRAADELGICQYENN
jgi:hypothetical protein